MILKMKCTQMGYMDKRPSRMQRSSQGRGVRPELGVRPWSGQAKIGGGGSGYFGIAHACGPDACNAHRGYLERSLTPISSTF